MSRKRITEFTAKKILYPALNMIFQGTSIITNSTSPTLDLIPTHQYVVKVDQGIKKRMNKGLMKVNVSFDEIQKFISEISKQGYSHFFIEEVVEHTRTDEKYISLERTREGIVIFYSNKGGIEIEDNKDSIHKILISNKDKEKSKLDEVSVFLEIPEQILQKILMIFDEYFFSFLEINPFIVKNGQLQILDLAVEVDSTAEFFVNNVWSSNDFVDQFAKHSTEEEKIVSKLAHESQAAFSLDVLNENGSIFVLLSGGGASLVIADEVYNLGYGKELANYGEFSGNPNAEETYLYTKAVLNLVLKSKAPSKVLIIGGGVANFTDIRTTFRGVIKALKERSSELKKENVTIFVRRGGPHQKEGLQMMKQFLIESDIRGYVFGPDVLLTEVVKKGVVQ